MTANVLAEVALVVGTLDVKDATSLTTGLNGTMHASGVAQLCVEDRGRRCALLCVYHPDSEGCRLRWIHVIECDCFLREM